MSEVKATGKKIEKVRRPYSEVEPYNMYTCPIEQVKDGVLPYLKDGLIERMEFTKERPSKENFALYHKYSQRLKLVEERLKGAK